MITIYILNELVSPKMSDQCQCDIHISGHVVLVKNVVLVEYTNGSPFRQIIT